jgi:hypothetical protein
MSVGGALGMGGRFGNGGFGDIDLTAKGAKSAKERQKQKAKG